MSVNYTKKFFKCLYLRTNLLTKTYFKVRKNYGKKNLFFLGNRRTPDRIKEQLEQVVEYHITDFVRYAIRRKKGVH